MQQNFAKIWLDTKRWCKRYESICITSDDINLNLINVLGFLITFFLVQKHNAPNNYYLAKQRKRVKSMYLFSFRSHCPLRDAKFLKLVNNTKFIFQLYYYLTKLLFNKILNEIERKKCPKYN